MQLLLPREHAVGFVCAVWAQQPLGRTRQGGHEQLVRPPHACDPLLGDLASPLPQSTILLERGTLGLELGRALLRAFERKDAILLRLRAPRVALDELALALQLSLEARVGRAQLLELLLQSLHVRTQRAHVGLGLSKAFELLFERPDAHVRAR